MNEHHQKAAETGFVGGEIPAWEPTVPNSRPEWQLLWVPCDVVGSGGGYWQARTTEAEEEIERMKKKYHKT